MTKNPFHRQLLCPISFQRFFTPHKLHDYEESAPESWCDDISHALKTRLPAKSPRQHPYLWMEILSPWSIVYLCFCCTFSFSLWKFPESHREASARLEITSQREPEINVKHIVPRTHLELHRKLQNCESSGWRNEIWIGCLRGTTRDMHISLIHPGDKFISPQIVARPISVCAKRKTLKSCYTMHQPGALEFFIIQKI